MNFHKNKLKFKPLKPQTKFFHVKTKTEIYEFKSSSTYEMFSIANIDSTSVRNNKVCLLDKQF